MKAGYLLLACLLATVVRAEDPVGAVTSAGTVLPTGQTVKPAGALISFQGRPVDLALTPNGATLFAKADVGLLVVDTATWTLRQTLDYGPGDACSMHGLAVAPDGRSLWLSSGTGRLVEAHVGHDGTWAWGREIQLPGPDKGSSYPCGVALSKDLRRALVALSRSNTLAVVDLEGRRALQEIPVGVAPCGMALSPDGKVAFVANWGGRRPGSGEHTMTSSGTPVLVDAQDLPASGTVSKVDLETGKVLREAPVGLHPAQVLLDRDGRRLFVANANSDTVSVLDATSLAVVETIQVRPDPALPYGSLSTALALAPDGRSLYVANAGNNAVAVVALGEGTPSRVTGFIPTGWFPAALVTDGTSLFIANSKGDGSRNGAPGNHTWAVSQNRGNLQKVAIPAPAELEHLTKQAASQSGLARTLEAMASRPRGARPAPVPRRTGDPSVFRHVIYVLKENRTYDQILGDLSSGNGDPALCVFGREVTPNHHALAEQFVLLDNYYCSGIVSADGHQWATQGITSDYQEKAFGEWTRSYDFGSDPLAFAPTPFLWDHAILAGHSFRNYGEFDFPSLDPDRATFKEVFEDWRSGAGRIRFKHSIPMDALRPYTSPDYPGWHLRIPDQLRADAFIRELAAFEAKGDWPELLFVYLPNDHTSGNSPGGPTPRAQVADNDLALGRIVEAVSRSRFWKDTCIFVNEDDPQAGFDHVDGHRSLCLVISPYSRREEVIHRFYNQGSVLRTIERILGLRPLNQLDAVAPTMEACFRSKPNFRPYSAVPARVPLDELVPPGPIGAFDLSRPDRIDDDAMNRVLWKSAKGNRPYPAAFAGAHGRGLKRRHLRLAVPRGKERDDDDDPVPGGGNRP